MVDQPEPDDVALGLLSSSLRQVRRLIDKLDMKCEKISELEREIERLEIQLNQAREHKGELHHGC